jgi:hypothetical protein
MVPTSEAVYFPKIQELFDESGKFLGKSQTGQARRLLAELIWYAEALKDAREAKAEK